MAIGLRSNEITFIDLTDNRSFSINIVCNLPAAQIYDVSSGTYTPDWSTTPLSLVPHIFVGSAELDKNDSKLTIQWQRQDGTSAPSYLTTGESVTNGTLTVSKNALSEASSGFVTYICTATYDGLSASSQVSFNLTISGANGTNGVNAYVHIKYGTSATPSELLDIPSDYMGIYSGSSQIPPTSYTEYRWFKIKGDDGTSVSIKDSAYCNRALTEIDIGTVVTIYEDALYTKAINSKTYPSLIDGDAYIVAGYLCVYNSTNDAFMCAGQVQGPKGEPGVTYYTWIKYADSETSATLYDTPTAIAGLKYIGISYNQLSQIPSNSYADYQWAKFVGDDGASAKYVIVNGEQVFKSPDGGTSYNPSSITLTASLYGGLTNYQWYRNDMILVGETSETYTVQSTDVFDRNTYKCVSDGGYYDSITVVKLADGTSGSPAPTAFLTNENITVLADANGLTVNGINMCSVVAYIGSTKVTPVIGELIGVPNGMTIIAGQDVLNEIPLTITMASNVSLAKSGTIYIPITYPVSTSLMLKWQRTDAAQNAVTFQIYAPYGYLLSNHLTALTLETFAYDGVKAISSDVKYTWYQYDDNDWHVINGQTGANLTITQADVIKSKSYRCVMKYKEQDYAATATVQDQSDTYNSIMCISSNTTSSNGEIYWVLFSMAYSESEEIDALLGPISINAPNTPLTNDYWYAVDETSLTVKLKQFNGTTWIDSSNTQQLDYCWSIVGNGNTYVTIGDTGKVQILSAKDFTSTVTLLCEVMSEDGILTQSTLSLTDVSDPVVSDTEPENAKHGQIWIKKNSDGSFLMFVWDDVGKTWVASDSGSHSKVYTSRPIEYSAGDLWITSSDDDHGSYLQGTLLQAQVSNTSYNADNWSPTLKYDKDLAGVQAQLEKLSQYVTINDDGLRIGAKDANGVLSPFTSLFTSQELTFYQNSDRLLTLANNKLTAPSIEVDNLQVNNSISLGTLRLVKENNGSFSFVIVS
jgi:hypothetical protein